MLAAVLVLGGHSDVSAETVGWYFEGIVDTLGAGIGGRGQNVRYCDVEVGDSMRGWFHFDPTFPDGDPSAFSGQYLGFNEFPDPIPVPVIEFSTPGGAHAAGNTNAFKIFVRLAESIGADGGHVQLVTTLTNPSEAQSQGACVSASDWMFEMYCGATDASADDSLPVLPWPCNGKVSESNFYSTPEWIIFPIGGFDLNLAAAPAGRLTLLCSDPDQDAVCDSIPVPEASRHTMSVTALLAMSSLWRTRRSRRTLLPDLGAGGFA